MRGVSLVRDFRSLKDDHPLPYPGASQAAEEIRQKAQDVGEMARDKRAQTHTILRAYPKNSDLINAGNEQSQERREHEAATHAASR
jgi:hypothetical protein